VGYQGTQISVRFNFPARPEGGFARVDEGILKTDAPDFFDLVDGGVRRDVPGYAEFFSITEAVANVIKIVSLIE
jgi:hypothetical protein